MHEVRHPFSKTHTKMSGLKGWITANRLKKKKNKTLLPFSVEMNGVKSGKRPLTEVINEERERRPRLILRPATAARLLSANFYLSIKSFAPPPLLEATTASLQPPLTQMDHCGIAVENQKDHPNYFLDVCA